ncbi:hypothetical protein [Mucilaginibacter sp.]|uniref:hypothetical protein n=1 Tax=Mucilaginibacter sp. TaxID=1882438 RepID=UPI0025F862D6|nr:hypothetical protein [Mucilaginibacter sp.]
MKKIFIEIIAVIIFCLLYSLVPQFRLAIIICGIVLGLWIVPVQLILSISYKNWREEIGDYYGNLNFEDRLAQIRNNFKGMTDAESQKLRLFYIHTLIFHYVFLVVYALAIMGCIIYLLYYGNTKSTPIAVSISILAALIVAIGGYFFGSVTLSVKQKKVRDEIYFLLISKDWRKKLKIASQSEFTSSFDEINGTSFYSFWLQGKTLEERQEAFKQFLISLNEGSKNGELFQFDEGKIKIIAAVQANAANKSLAGFLRFCIEEYRVLSPNILHHKNRELLRDIFVLNPEKDLVFLEGQRYITTSAEYTDVYKQALKN